MLNFTFIIYGDINQTSGGYYYDREFIKALKKRGHSVNIADARDEDIKKYKTDIYIIDELCHPDFYKRKNFERLKSGVPVAAMVHHLAADEDINRLSRVRHLHMERGFFKRIDFAVFNSISTMNSSQNKGRYKGPNSIAVPGREDNRAVGKTYNEYTSELSLLFIGNIIPRKSLHHVIRHLSGFADIPFKMTVAGDCSAAPAYTKKLEKLISKYNLQEKIDLRGKVSETEKERLFRGSDILLMPSSHEGYGIAYIEAMRYGLIPIAGLSGGASEIIKDEENGYLIDPVDSRQLKTVLNKLWKDPVLKNNISRAAVNSWIAHPGWDQTFNKMIDTLEELVVVGE